MDGEDTEGAVFMGDKDFVDVDEMDGAKGFDGWAGVVWRIEEGGGGGGGGWGRGGDCVGVVGGPCEI